MIFRLLEFITGEEMGIKLPKGCPGCKNCKECEFQVDSFSFKGNAEVSCFRPIQLKHAQTDWQLQSGNRCACLAWKKG